MASDPFASPRDPVSIPDRSDDTLGRVTGVLLLVFGGLECAFGAFAGLGAFMGAVFMFTPPPDPDAAFLGPMLMGIYGFLLVGALTAGVLHLIGGYQLMRPVPNRAWLWAAAAGSIGSLITMYCTVFGIAAAVLLLIWLTRPEPAAEPELDAL